MSEKEFRFQQFTICQDHAAMKVGTDGILLGAWSVPALSTRRLLDIGTGTGLLALMMAQRFPDLLIDAIELDKFAVKDTRENFGNSSWADRLHIEEGNVLNWKLDPLKAGLYDMVISNPPFFPDGMRAPDDTRSRARHQDDLPVEGFWTLTDHILSRSGQVDVIFPASEKTRWCNLASETGFFLRRISSIRARPQKPITRVLASFCRVEKDISYTEWCIRDEMGNHYSGEYIALTKMFYLASAMKQEEIDSQQTMKKG